jgi:hypothetical protein
MVLSFLREFFKFCLKKNYFDTAYGEKSLLITYSVMGFPANRSTLINLQKLRRYSNKYTFGFDMSKLLAYRKNIRGARINQFKIKGA